VTIAGKGTVASALGILLVVTILLDLDIFKAFGQQRPLLNTALGKDIGVNKKPLLDAKGCCQNSAGHSGNHKEHTESVRCCGVTLKN
jgi:hypothetical protein